ncbi:hypothetical protein D3C85_539630 [compost metagenome]
MTVNWLEYQTELGVLLQPSLGLFAFVNDLVIEDQRDSFGSSVVETQLFQHGDQQGLVFLYPTDVKHSSVACIENACLAMFCILPRCDSTLFLRSEHPVGP